MCAQATFRRRFAPDVVRGRGARGAIDLVEARTIDANRSGLSRIWSSNLRAIGEGVRVPSSHDRTSDVETPTSCANSAWLRFNDRRVPRTDLASCTSGSITSIVRTVNRPLPLGLWPPAMMEQRSCMLCRICPRKLRGRSRRLMVSILFASCPEGIA